MNKIEDKKRRLRIERAQANFAAEAEIIERLIKQLTTRFCLMEDCIIRLQSTVIIQMAFRSYVARQKLFLLRTIRFLGDWIYYHTLRRKRQEKANVISNFIWNMHMRAFWKVYLKRAPAASKICKSILFYRVKKRMTMIIAVLVISHNLFDKAFDNAMVEIEEREKSLIRQLILARKRLCALLWPIYVRYQRRKM